MFEQQEQRRRIAQMENRNVAFEVQCSYFEIYMEQIYDLLETTDLKLQLRENDQAVFVEGVSWEKTKTSAECLGLISKGSSNRHIGETMMNRESSRSHTVFTAEILIKEIIKGETKTMTSRMHLIDLAGSEKMKDTQAVGERAKEAGQINKSLSALLNVVRQLASEQSKNKKTHIHYRDSKLTYYLRDSLGGNARTFIIANISPVLKHFKVTQSTLKFAQSAKQIKNKAVKNEEQNTVKFWKEKFDRLKSQVKEMGKGREIFSK